MVDEAKDDDILAAELALGLLEGEDRAQAMRKSLSDNSFSDNVAAWSKRLDPMFDEFTAFEPDPAVWKQINSAIDDSSVSDDNQVTDILMSRLNRWRMGAIGSGAVAASLALALLYTGNTANEVAQPSERAVAQLTGDIEGLILAVSYNPDNAEMKINVSGMPDTDTQPEVWIVSPNQKPQSLGQIGRDGLSAMTVASDHRPLINSASLLVLTMEPESSVPHDAPSGDPVASGKISFI